MINTILNKVLIILLFVSANYYSQNIYLFAGTGIAGFSGDGGSAVNAQFDNLGGIGVDGSGNVYAADGNNNRVRKINSSGIISTFAGTGGSGYSGDGGPATSAQLSYPTDVNCDAAGNVYVYDSYNFRIRKINTSGIISTVAGNGLFGNSGDGGLAINASLSDVKRIAIDAAGNIYLAHRADHRIRKINTTGIITTIAGTGVLGYSGDGGSATSAQIAYPRSLAIDAAGNLYIGEDYNSRIRKVNTLGIISTYAGNGASGDAGDGGPAANAQLSTIEGLGFDAAGNLYIASFVNASVRKVNTSGIISKVAGAGIGSEGGNGGPAINATISPSGLAVDALGNIFIPSIQMIREVCIGNCVSGINSQTQDNYSISLYPNPISDSFKIKLDADFKNTDLVLINTLGQKVLQQSILKGENNIITSHLASGLYTYIIFKDMAQIKFGKLIIH